MVMPVVRSSDGLSATVTQSLRPSKLRARPKRPATRLGPLSVPGLPAVEVAMSPAVSSKPQAPTSFFAAGWASGKTDGCGIAVALGSGLGDGSGLGLGLGLG